MNFYQDGRCIGMISGVFRNFRIGAIHILPPHHPHTKKKLSFYYDFFSLTISVQYKS
jgi:hypothetical protein